MNVAKSKNGNALFQKCPSCGSSSMHRIDADVLCLDCCWDSTAWSVASGAMDDLVYAAEENNSIECISSDAFESAPIYQIAL